MVIGVVVENGDGDDAAVVTGEASGAFCVVGERCTVWDLCANVDDGDADGIDLDDTVAAVAAVAAVVAAPAAAA